MDYFKEKSAVIFYITMNFVILNILYLKYLSLYYYFRALHFDSQIPLCSIVIFETLHGLWRSVLPMFGCIALTDTIIISFSKTKK